MSLSEQEAAAALEINTNFLLAQEEVEDFGVAVDEQGNICIEIRYKEDLPDSRRRAIQQQFGSVPVSFGRADRGKMAY